MYSIQTTLGEINLYLEVSGVIVPLSYKHLKLSKTNKTVKSLKDELISRAIAQKYTTSDELAIQRKKISGADNGEFDTYNVFVESVKSAVAIIINS